MEVSKMLVKLNNICGYIFIQEEEDFFLQQLNILKYI